MTLTEKHIRHYNRLNGKIVSKKSLHKFHARLKKDIEAGNITEKSLYGPELIRIEKVLLRGIKEVNGHTMPVELKPIPVGTRLGTSEAPPPAAFINMQKKGRLWPQRRRNPSGKITETKTLVVSKEVKPKNLVAEEIAISKIHTDTKRFQNRTDAFSEASAESVANNYDPNKFDPIVVWFDPKAKKLFVLSGHSRYEGMVRRKSKTIPVRYFKGNEEQAIKFAKVEANRAANQESLIEDLTAYVLMRDGDASKGIKKLTKTELGKIFKGKVPKLEAYSHLSAGGLFVNALNQGTTSNYPYLERNAQWVGQLRKDHAVISNAGEDNIFHFFYSDKSGKNLKQSKDEFFKLAIRKINQLGKGEGVLFPECSSDGCVKVNDKETDPIKGESYKRLREINETITSIKDKLSSKDPKVRVTTEEEKKYLRDTAQRLETEKEKIQRDLDIMDKSQSSLFGLTKEIPLKDILTEGKQRFRQSIPIPTISSKAFKGNNKIWFVQYQPGPSSDKVFVEKYNAAIKAGYIAKRYKASGGYQNAWILERNNMVLTASGFDSLHKTDEPWHLTFDEFKTQLVPKKVSYNYTHYVLPKYSFCIVSKDETKNVVYKPCYFDYGNSTPDWEYKGDHKATTNNKIEAFKMAYDHLIDWAKRNNKLNGPQIDAFNIPQKKKHKGPLNPLQQAQLIDAIKAGRTPKVNWKAKVNAKKTEAPLFEPATDPKQQSLFGSKTMKSKKRLGFISADQTPAKAADLFTLPGEIGKFLGELQRYKGQIVLAGEFSSGKSELAKQIANAFAAIGDNVGFIDWEQGGLHSRDTQAGIKRNIDLVNRKRVHVSDQVPKTIEAIKKIGSEFPVVIIDSGSKIQSVTNAWLDELREEYPKTFWIVLMQLKENGNTRGGSSADFNAPTVIKTFRPDKTDYTKNYAELVKNRGNQTGIFYNISKKKIIKPGTL